MTLALIPILVLLLISITEALVSQPQRKLNVTEWSSSLDPLPGALLAAPIDLTLPLNESSLNEWDTDCDAATYGNHLSVQSCLQTFLGMGIGSTQHIYRDRADPIPSDRQLPSLIVAGMLL